MKRPDLYPSAHGDALQALSYIKKNAPPAIGHDFGARLDNALIEIGLKPLRFPRWQQTQARKYALDRFPCFVFYRVYPDCVRILAIARASRRPGYWKRWS